MPQFLMASIVLLALNKDVQVFTEVWCWVDRLVAGVQSVFIQRRPTGIHPPNVQDFLIKIHLSCRINLNLMYSSPVMNYKGL